jgi:exodeoxyribonuclease VII small subunit
MEKNLTYESAYEELQQITIAIENETVTIDQLAVKLKRAAELISFCQSRLRTTESEVAKIADQLK